LATAKIPVHSASFGRAVDGTGYENRFLESLSAPTRQQLLQGSEPVQIPLAHQLFRAEGMPRSVTILTDGLVSLIYNSAHGKSLELATIGCEGPVGWHMLLGGLPPLYEGVMQMEGRGYRVPMKHFRECFEDNPELRRRVLEFAQHQLNLGFQVIACQRFHSARERFARWLLMVLDRTGRYDLRMTQEFFAAMLGAQRTTVNETAGRLQREGAIEYKRGRVKIVDRKKLEAAACACYPVLQKQLHGLYKA